VEDWTTMIGRGERFKTAILAVLPLVVVTAVVCPACSAVALGVDLAPGCARASSGGGARAGAEEPAQGCHAASTTSPPTPTSASLAVRSQGPEGSCCIVEAAERAESPDAVASPAPAWSAALLPTAEIELERSLPTHRLQSQATLPLSTPLYRLHRALLI
jgi:hypothetical protein